METETPADTISTPKRLMDVLLGRDEAFWQEHEPSLVSPNPRLLDHDEPWDLGSQTTRQTLQRKRLRWLKQSGLLEGEALDAARMMPR